MLRLNRQSNTDDLKVGRYHISTKHIEESLVNQDPSLCFKLQLESDFQLKLDPVWLEAAQEVSLRPGMSMAEPIMEMAEAVLPVENPSGPRPGQMEYDIPDAMTLGKATTCIIRIGDKNVTDIRINEVSVNAAIRICDEMSVQIIDLDGGNFTIRSLSSERQAIEKGAFTEWKINVTPLQTGTFSLLLKVFCHFDGKTKDSAVLEKSVRVSADPSLLPSVRKIAFIAAGAKSGLLLGKESNEIWEELRLAPFRDDFAYVKYFEVTNLQFNRALEFEKPTIVHFSGHGSVDGIFLADTQGNPQLVSRQAMAGLFKALQTEHSQIECVVLNACLSHELAQELSGCVSVVIGTNTKIGDDKAIQFSEFFYRALGKRQTYKQAFEFGRVIVSPEPENELEGDELLVCLMKQPL